MNSYKERVVNERDDLVEKLHKLDEFISGDGFSSIETNSQELLKRQSVIMDEYVFILNERIRLFTLGEN